MTRSVLTPATQLLDAAALASALAALSKACMTASTIHQPERPCSLQAKWPVRPDIFHNQRHAAPCMTCARFKHVEIWTTHRHACLSARGAAASSKTLEALPTHLRVRSFALQTASTTGCCTTHPAHSGAVTRPRRGLSSAGGDTMSLWAQQEMYSCHVYDVSEPRFSQRAALSQRFELVDGSVPCVRGRQCHLAVWLLTSGSVHCTGTQIHRCLLL